MFGHMMNGMGITTCILMFLLGLAAIGGIVYFAVSLALRNTKELS